MKKALAVSQIILLVLGVLVLAVIAYLLYTNFIGSVNQIDAAKCTAEKTNECLTLKSSGGTLTGVLCIDKGKFPDCGGTLCVAFACSSVGVT